MRSCGGGRQSSSSGAPPPGTPSWPVSPSPRATRWSSSTPRPTGTRPSSPTPTASTSPATPTPTCRSGSAPTSASAPPWPSSRPRFSSPSCSPASPTWRWPAPPSASDRTSSTASATSRSASPPRRSRDERAGVVHRGLEEGVLRRRTPAVPEARAARADRRGAGCARRRHRADPVRRRDRHRLRQRRRGDRRAALEPAGPSAAAVRRRTGATDRMTASLTAPLTGLRTNLGRTLRRSANGLRLLGGLDRPHTGCTPHLVVWRKDRATLRRYRAGAVAGRPPVLLVPSLINRSHIWDLRPGDSFVEGLLERGYDVFLIDWGVADQRDAANTMSTYVDGHLPAAYAVVEELAGARPAVLGHCFGGVIAILWAATVAHQPPALVALGVPTNWAELGPLSKITQQGWIEPEDVLDDTGNVPPRTLLRAFQMLRPLGDLAGYVTSGTGSTTAAAPRPS